jgi:predicted SAM-dependent methyltransferase
MSMASDRKVVTRVHVGCGPKNLMQDWWNVDIRGFKGLDEVFDVTQPWPWTDLEFVYGEHFLEHLNLEGAFKFLTSACRALRPGGRLRLSTPSLEWVLKTHFTFESSNDSSVSQTLNLNRAFHGWGHQFLYSRAMLEQMLIACGFHTPSFHEYGISNTEALNGLEKHGGYRIAHDYPSVWIVEATPTVYRGTDEAFLARCHENFIRYVASGH